MPALFRENNTQIKMYYIYYYVCNNQHSLYLPNMNLKKTFNNYCICFQTTLNSNQTYIDAKCKKKFTTVNIYSTVWRKKFQWKPEYNYYIHTLVWYLLFFHLCTKCILKGYMSRDLSSSPELAHYSRISKTKSIF